MPALKPVPATARVTVRGTSQGQAIVNVFHVRWTGGNMTTADVTYMANLVATNFGSKFRPLLNANWSGDSVRAVDLSLATGAEATVALPGQGALTGIRVPQSAACCVTWRILKHYRGGHPRTYLGPLGDSAMENSTSLEATFLTSANTAANGFLNAINAGTTGGQTMKLVAVHRWSGGVEIIVPQTSDILSATVDSRIDTMRRRLGRDR